MSPLLVAEPSFADFGLWSTAGPDGGTVYLLVSNPARPDVLYAGTDNGVFKSLDGGSTWQAANAGLPAGAVQVIAIDPADASRLYASPYNRGLYRSTDSGATWQESDTGLTCFEGLPPDRVRLTAIGVDPHSSRTLYAACASSPFAFKSIDGGDSWQRVQNPPFTFFGDATGFVFDPVERGVIFVTGLGRLCKTVDGGQTWVDLNGSPGGPLVIDPSQHTTLYGVQWPNGGVYKSLDSGQTWKEINRGLPSLLFGAKPPILALAVDSRDPATIYAGSFGFGVFRSTDRGANWLSANAGAINLRISCLLAASGASAPVYAGAFGGGVFKSDDQAVSWRPARSGLRTSTVGTLAADADSATLFASTQGGVFVSRNSGATWLEFSEGLADGFVPALAVDATAAVVFAGTIQAGVFRSVVGEASWQPVNTGIVDPDGALAGPVLALATDAPSHTVFAAVGATPDFDGAVFRSTDRGATWSMTARIPPQYRFADRTAILAVAPAPDSALYYGGDSGQLFRSRDSGDHWEPILPPGCLASAFAFAPSAPATIYAGASALCASSDSGFTWEQFEIPVGIKGGAEGQFLRALAVDPVTPSTVYAATNDGVFVSRSGGRNWKSLGLEGLDVSNLLLSPDGKILHAGKAGVGVLDLNLSELREAIAAPHRSALPRVVHR